MIRCSFHAFVVLAGCLLLAACIGVRSPEVAMSIEPSSGYAPLPVRLEARSSEDSGTWLYSWTFSDGQSAEGRIVELQFEGKGTVTVSLTATDADGIRAVAEGAIELLNRLPEARFTYVPHEPAVLVPIHFDGSASNDPDGEIVAYRWDFGDGETAEGPKVSHAFQVPQCDYRVTLTVTDDGGATNETYRVIEPFGCDHD